MTSYPRTGTAEMAVIVHRSWMTQDRPQGDAMMFPWDRPRKSERDQLDMIRAVVHFDGAAGAAKRIKVDPDEPFPTSMRVDLPRKGRWLDAHVHLIVYDKDEDGRTIGNRSWISKPQSPALYGSRIVDVNRLALAPSRSPAE